MSADVEIICGLPGAGKTERLLQEYRSAQPGAALWIAPTDRARAAIHPRLASDADGSAALATLPELARRIVLAENSRLKIAPELHQRFLLESVIAESVRRGELRHFADIAGAPGFASALFDLVTELKGRSITPAALAAHCRQCFGDRAKDSDLTALFAAYQKRIADLDLVDRETMYSRATALIAAGRLGPWTGVRSILLDGFVEFTAPQLELLSAVAGQVERMVVTLVADEERRSVFERTSKTEVQLLERFPDCRTEYMEPQRGTGPLNDSQYLARRLFRSRAEESPQAATGSISLLKGPGPLGEARMVARAIGSLLESGAEPDSIIVASRRLSGDIDLWVDVLREYGVEVDVDRSPPFVRDPVVATLLRALRLPEADFAFGPTTSLLRSTLLVTDADLRLRCDALIRGLGVTGGREAIMQAATSWATAPEPPLDDEEGDEPHRKWLHGLARQSAPFLTRFFACWDRLAAAGDLESWISRIGEFVDDVGLDRSDALGRLMMELEAWSASAGRFYQRMPELTLSGFADLATRIAASVSAPVQEVAYSRVRILSAEQARAVECDHLFLIGLGEGSYPSSPASDPFYSEGERNQLQAAGLDVRNAVENYPDEQLLFYQLAAKSRKSLTLSYPASDARGIELLPGAFLIELLSCFEPGTVTTIGHTMLLGVLADDPPRSAAENRVRWARRKPSERAPGDGDLFAHLRRAEELADHRFHRKVYSPFDGLIESPGIRADLATRFGPERTYSPTSLERFVACPFKFFAGDVLGLTSLEVPDELIAATSRGAVVHRALARVHRSRRAAGAGAPDDALAADLTSAIDVAVNEEIGRAAGPVARMLWRLEGRRLQRMMNRHAHQWTDQFGKWAEAGVEPVPDRLELSFGLPGAEFPALTIDTGGESIRVSGRIDRIDVSPLPDGSAGFLVIDYKTGSQAIPINQIASMQRLQLPLYSMAVEGIMAGARPLGMGYWLLGGGGQLGTFPPRKLWLSDAADWLAYRARLGEWIGQIVKSIRSGKFVLQPRADDCTATCEFGEMCRIAQSRRIGKEGGLALPEDSGDE